MDWWSQMLLLLLPLVALLANCEVADGVDDDIDLDDIDGAKPSYVAPRFVTPKPAGNPYFVDWFGDASAIGKKWILSKGKKDDVEDSIAKYNGEWQIGAPTKVIIEDDLGLIVKTRARHHAIAAKFSRPFKFDGQPLVVQYEVKYEDGQECGGGYVKLLSQGVEQKLNQFTDKTPYTIMMGPDKCGPTPKIHFIVRFRNPKNGTIAEHHAKQSTSVLSSYFDDHKTHLYTLVIRPDESFTVSVDDKKIMSGSLLKDLEPAILPPTVIDDPDDKKPDDWDEREKIDDPEAKKPDDWDESAPKKIEDASAQKPDDWLEDAEQLIADSEAEKPSDWDESIDGDWEAPKIDNPKCKDVSGCGPWKRPMIENPNFKGKWKPSRIANPAYRGKWTPRQVENPNFFEPHPYSELQSVAAIGIEIWTMSANIVFDNIYVGDSEQAAAEFARETFGVKTAQEVAYDSISSPSTGVFDKLVTATEERPWLWAVYVLSVLIPVIIVSVFCFGRKSRPSTPGYKKTDEPQPDDEVPELVGDDDEDDESIEEASHDGEENVVNVESSNQKRRASGSPSRLKANIQESVQATDNAPKTDDDVVENGDGEELGANQSSPRARRLRQRKQD